MIRRSNFINVRLPRNNKIQLIFMMIQTSKKTKKDRRILLFTLCESRKRDHKRKHPTNIKTMWEDPRTEIPKTSMKNNRKLPLIQKTKGRMVLKTYKKSVKRVEFNCISMTNLCNFETGNVCMTC